MNRPMKVAVHQKYTSSVNKLASSDQERVRKAIEKYQQAPDMPGLNLERLKGNAGKKRLCTIRASDKLRVLLVREGPTSVLLRAGRHVAIDRLAKGSEFVTPLKGIPRLIGTSPDVVDVDDTPLESKPVVPGPAPDPERSILEHWKHNELTQAGFNKDEIRRLRRSTQDTLLKVWPKISQETRDRVLEMAEQSPDKWLQRRLIADDEGRHERFRKAIVERGALGGLSSLLDPEEFRRLMSAPIEDWMIFLHPDQRDLVDRSFNGPARVRGSAGTGKTVVALHRAAALAKRFHGPANTSKTRPILFTTFIKSLPPVFENLYQKLPTAVAGAVEFINVHKLASKLCRQAGERYGVNEPAVSRAFDQAFKAVVQSGTPLHRVGLTYSYLREEVQAVLKGRGVDSPDEYLKMDRTGRRTPFTHEMREQAWRLRVEWDRHLSEAGIVDYSDIVRKARDIARQRPEPIYRTAIVDESQDITLVGLQLIRALVSGADGRDRPNALFIVGDGAQKIYPGGFTLAQAGLEVRGSSAVLRVNYRNTREIIDTAMACAGSERVDDHGDNYARGEADAESVRDGVKPRLVQKSNFEDQVSYVVKQAKQLCKDQSLGFGDIGILVSTNELVRQTIRELRYAPFGHQKLEEFTGRSNNRVKVGTFDRAKGLEFKIVFLLGISEESLPTPRKDNETHAEYEERRALEISRLFVAMTRARDHLFVLYDNKPSDIISTKPDHFNEVEA